VRRRTSARGSTSLSPISSHSSSVSLAQDLQVRHVEGPVGVQSRNFSNARIESLGFQPRMSVREGIASDLTPGSERASVRLRAVASKNL